MENPMKGVFKLIKQPSLGALQERRENNRFVEIVKTVQVVHREEEWGTRGQSSEPQSHGGLKAEG
jgi:hypothetical protein